MNDTSFGEDFCREILPGLLRETVAADSQEIALRAQFETCVRENDVTVVGGAHGSGKSTLCSSAGNAYMGGLLGEIYYYHYPRRSVPGIQSTGDPFLIAERMRPALDAGVKIVVETHPAFLFTRIDELRRQLSGVKMGVVLRPYLSDALMRKIFRETIGFNEEYVEELVKVCGGQTALILKILPALLQGAFMHELGDPRELKNFRGLRPTCLSGDGSEFWLLASNWRVKIVSQAYRFFAGGRELGEEAPPEPLVGLLADLAIIDGRDVNVAKLRSELETCVVMKDFKFPPEVVRPQWKYFT